MRQILARVCQPQTNGKLERFDGELQRKLHKFEDVGGPTSTGCPIGGRKIETDPIVRFIRRYNYDRPHKSLDWSELETPARAFLHKMQPKDDHVAIELEEHAGYHQALMRGVEIRPDITRLKAERCCNA